MSTGCTYSVLTRHVVHVSGIGSCTYMNLQTNTFYSCYLSVAKICVHGSLVMWKRVAHIQAHTLQAASQLGIARQRPDLALDLSFRSSNATGNIIAEQSVRMPFDKSDSWAR